MSIRDVLSRYANLQTADKDLFDPTKLPPAAENMCCEIYNPGAEIIDIRSIHPEWHRMHFFGLPPEYWLRLQCKPGEWCFLPHRMWVFSVPSGNQRYEIIQNVGAAMFKGNKRPSRPDVKKVRVFQ